MLMEERNRMYFLNMCMEAPVGWSHKLSQPSQPKTISLGLGIVCKAEGNSKKTDAWFLLFWHSYLYLATVVATEITVLI